jgi:uncharacterized protein YggE
MFQESYMRKIVAVVGVMAIIALGAYTYYTMKQAEYMYAGPTTISVTGTGEVFAKPDVASFTFSVEAKEADASATQNKAAETMNAVLAYLKEAGVDEKDVKTEYYSLSPRYEYPETVCNEWGYCPPQNGEPKLIGYQVSQSVSVKVRDMAKSGEIISGVGGKGAMNVSSLSFTIDDEDAFKADARKQAIEDAQEKVKVLAENLGVRIVRMNGYWEEESSYPGYYGMGGGMEYADSAMSMKATPEMPTGENTITAKVNVSYEVK